MKHDVFKRKKSNSSNDGHLPCLDATVLNDYMNN